MKEKHKLYSEYYELNKGEKDYPGILIRELKQEAPEIITVLGNLDIINETRIGLFCSRRCPGDIILNTFDQVRLLRDKGLTIISGFHSPIEKDCLDFLLRGSQPIIICPARSIENMRIPSTLRDPLDSGRLLFLSPFPEKKNYISTSLSKQRNEFVAALSSHLFIPYAAPNSSTLQLAQKAISWNKPIYTINSTQNPQLTNLSTKNIQNFLN